jgi:nucleoside-diphosphate-sugar epimerase
MNNILIIGGTQMLGKEFVNQISQQNKYNIFIANRGVTNPLFLKEAAHTHIKIDRNFDAECTKLLNYTFDIVIDFSCYTVNQFKNTYKYLKYKKYIYISTMSVHEKHIISNPNLANDYHRYCVDKFLIEEYIKQNKIKNCLIVRPCAIYGDDDYTNRFYKKDGEYYWKSNNSKVGVGTMHVEDFSQFLLYHINEYPEVGSIDVCDIWWT